MQYKQMKNLILFILLLVMATGTVLAQEMDTTHMQQPETFTMQWKDSTITMQKYFVVFLKAGPERSQSKEEAQEIQKQHMQHLEMLALQEKTSITGPTDGNSDIRGFVIF